MGSQMSEWINSVGLDAFEALPKGITLPAKHYSARQLNPSDKDHIYLACSLYLDLLSSRVCLKTEFNEKGKDGRCRDRWKSREKTNIRTKRNKGTLHPRCVESIVEKQLIPPTEFELICCYVKDMFLTVVP